MSFELEPWQFSQGLIEITAQIPIDTYPEEDSVLSGDYDELLNASVIKRLERWRKHSWFIKQCKTANWDEMDDLDKELFLLTVLDMDLLYTQAMLDADAAHILRDKGLLHSTGAPSKEDKVSERTDPLKSFNRNIVTENVLRESGFQLQEYPLFTEEGTYTGTITAMCWRKIRGSRREALAVFCDLENGTKMSFHVWWKNRTDHVPKVNKTHVQVGIDAFRSIHLNDLAQFTFVKRDNPSASDYTPLVKLEILDSTNS